ncbi:MAG TPA: hypothetical protein GXZ30_06220, partial [Propionibacterium sp.]|nr:hypothetical protein [Propionibacterium sp.]
MHEIQAAYAVVTRFALAHGFDPALIDPQKTSYSPDELNAGVLNRMTPPLRERWQARVTEALDGDQEAKDGIRLLQFYDWEQPDWTLPPEGKVLRSQWIRDGEVGLTEATEDSPERMKITITHEAHLSFAEREIPFDLTVVKRVSYWMLENPEGTPSWLIDEYEGIFSVGDGLPVAPANQEPVPSATNTPDLEGPGGPEAPVGDPLDSIAVAPESANAPPANPVRRDPAGGAPVKDPVQAPPPPAPPAPPPAAPP